jgi:hypothetical protein
MTPDDIRRIYRREREATDAEARVTFEAARTDPAVARTLIAVLFSLSVEDRDFALMLRLFLEGTLMRYIQERADADDQEALACGQLITDLMHATMPPPRGKPGKAKTA